MRDPKAFLRWLRAPVAQFALIGGGIFGLYAAVGTPEPPKDVAREPIVLTAPLLETLGRTVTAENAGGGGGLVSLDQVVEQYVENEVYYREALAQGLDRDDPVVRNRLVQKMKFLAEDLEPTAEPSAQDLAAYVAAHPERFTQPASWTFHHVFFTASHADAKHWASRVAEANATRRTLLRSGRDGAKVGEPFLAGQRFVAQSRARIEERFGAELAQVLATTAVGTWSGPVASPYGVHLLYVEAHTDAAREPLAAATEAARQLLLDERRQQANAAALARLKQKYPLINDATKS